MKFSTFLLLLILGGGMWFWLKSPQIKMPAALETLFAGSPEPRLSLMQMTKQFPKRARGGRAITEVATYMEKQDDPLFPLAGYLSFHCGTTYEYVFNWIGNRWVFFKMKCRDNEHDITLEPEGAAIMLEPEMQRFLDQYRLSGTAAGLPMNFNPPPVAATPVPRRTPTPQESALDVARKYGGAR